VGDREVPGLLKVFTFLSRAEIEDLERQTAERPQARAGQRALAESITTLVHGADATARVIAASRALFGQGDLADIDERTLADACSEVPHTEVFLASPDEALPPFVDLMALTGIVPSKSAARRAVAEGGAYLNNTKVTAEDAVPTRADLLHGRYLILRRGKRTVGAVDVRTA
jgi:tyrosyl-tRNA synthetase